MGFFVFLVCMILCLNQLAWTREESPCQSVDGAALLLPADATRTTPGQYLALSKA